MRHRWTHTNTHTHRQSNLKSLVRNRRWKNCILIFSSVKIFCLDEWSRWFDEDNESMEYENFQTLLSRERKMEQGVYRWRLTRNDRAIWSFIINLLAVLYSSSHKTQQLSPRLKLRPPLGVIHKRTVVSSTFTPSNFKRLRVERSHSSRCARRGFRSPGDFYLIRG